MDPQKRCVSVQFTLWTVRPLQHYPQRLFSSYLPSRYCQNLTEMGHVNFGIAHIFLLFGLAQFYLHNPKRKQNKNPRSISPMLNIGQFCCVCYEGRIRGDIPELQTRSLQTRDSVWKIDTSSFSSLSKCSCRRVNQRGPFRLNCYGVIDIYQDSSLGFCLL